MYQNILHPYTLPATLISYLDLPFLKNNTLPLNTALLNFYRP
ncbi:hypothetical protein VP424E501_P0163 [Vibrio phage 424E50-1]|nr:hypothetical protein VP424E501_P0163 [Vibrio phage 424E50-1]